MTHRCHTHGCATPVKPELLMCLRHWRMVPPDLQRAVWATYRPGQCDDMRPSRDWHDAAAAAIGYVACREGHPALSKNEALALDAAGYRALLLARFKTERDKAAAARVLDEARVSK